MDRGSDKTTQGLLPGPMVWVMTAALGYTVLAVYLFVPYWGEWDRWQALWPVNMVVGAMGVYLLGRRWISSRPASLLSGAVYGFSPLAIYMTQFHPVAGFLAAMVPWLFCPIAYVPRWIGGVNRQFLGRTMGWWVQGPFLAAPFLVILGMFALLEHYRLFPIPLYKGALRLEDWMGWVAPWVAAQQGRMPSGLYHVPLAALTFALVMVVKARRWPILVVTAAGLILAGFSPLLQVSPMTWLCVALTWMAVLVGLGLDGLVWAGWADRGWLVVALVVVSGLGLGALGWASYTGYQGASDSMWAMIHTFRMYGLAAASVGLVLAIVLVRVRLLPFRQGAIFVAVGLDLVLTARLLVDALL
jgi:hypothetical protein